MSDDIAITHLNAARFLAQRAIAAQSVVIEPIMTFALPGSLVPIHRDRIEAHQEDGLSADEIVQYENAHFLKTNIRVRERHAQWVGREYDAMVQAHQEIEAEKRRREMEASAAYQRRLTEILAQKDGG
jgi:hypothetical protein